MHTLGKLPKTDNISTYTLAVNYSVINHWFLPVSSTKAQLSIKAQMISPNQGAMKVHYPSLVNVSTLQKCWGLTQVPCGPQTWWDVGGHSRVPPGGRVTSYLLCPTSSPQGDLSGDLADFLLTPHALASNGLHTSHLLASKHFLSQKA